MRWEIGIFGGDEYLLAVACLFATFLHILKHAYLLYRDLKKITSKLNRNARNFNAAGPLRLHVC